MLERGSRSKRSRQRTGPGLLGTPCPAVSPEAGCQSSEQGGGIGNPGEGPEGDRVPVLVVSPVGPVRPEATLLVLPQRMPVQPRAQFALVSSPPPAISVIGMGTVVSVRKVPRGIGKGRTACHRAVWRDVPKPSHASGGWRERQTFRTARSQSLGPESLAHRFQTRWLPSLRYGMWSGVAWPGR